VAGEREREGRGKWIAGGVGLAALLYLLLRQGSGSGDATSNAPAASLPPCRVRIDQAGLQLDGAPADLPTTVARCRAAGAADVTATGAAIVGTIAEVVRALQDAGVIVRAAPSIWNVIGSVPARSS